VNTTDTVATWPELQAGQVRWLGEWQDKDGLSFRFFVGRHALGAAFAGDLMALDDEWSFAAAPWVRGPRIFSGPATDRVAAKASAEQMLFKMLGVDA